MEKKDTLSCSPISARRHTVPLLLANVYVPRSGGPAGVGTGAGVAVVTGGGATVVLVSSAVQTLSEGHEMQRITN